MRRPISLSVGQPSMRAWMATYHHLLRADGQGKHVGFQSAHPETFLRLRGQAVA